MTFYANNYLFTSFGKIITFSIVGRIEKGLTGAYDRLQGKEGRHGGFGDRYFKACFPHLKGRFERFKSFFDVKVIPDASVISIFDAYFPHLKGRFLRRKSTFDVNIIPNSFL